MPAQRKYRENAIIRADARHLARHVRPGSVALTVTSPPYRNAIDYTQHVANLKDSGAEWMRGTGVEKTDAYLDTMERIFGQVFEATKEGGFCCIVIGDEVVNGKLVPLPSLLLSRLANQENEDDPGRWRLRDTIIWHKVTSGRNGSGNRFGIFVQFPYPGYFRANIMHEYILVLQKGAAAGPTPRDGDGRIPLNRIVKRELANSVWNIPPVPPRTVDHPVPFPEQIPWRLATLLTRKGDMVLDPMNGSGQTTKVAHHMGRRYLGLDIRKEYVDEAKRRLVEAPKLSDYLIPVFYKESWSKDVQGGFFETTEVDLSPNIPKGYGFLFRTDSDRSVRGQRGVHAYYRSPVSGYLCFAIGPTGKHSRLHLGGVEDGGSVLHDFVARLPAGRFAKADLRGIAGTGIVDRHQRVQACIDVLLHLGHVRAVDRQARLCDAQQIDTPVSADHARAADGRAQKQHYELTPEGRSLQRRLR